MTEMMGGSDVRGGTQTVARHIDGNKYALTGLKWFTSAIDADMTFALAYIINKDGQITVSDSANNNNQNCFLG